MIFVDTSAWYAMVVESDPHHATVNACLADNTEELITTDYVVDETLTLLRARSRSRKAVELGAAFFSDRIASVYKLTEADLNATWAVFSKFADKDWSFTDCSSKVVMEKLRIGTALSLDKHFAQFSDIIVLP